MIFDFFALFIPAPIILVLLSASGSLFYIYGHMRSVWVCMALGVTYGCFYLGVIFKIYIDFMKED